MTKEELFRINFPEYCTKKECLSPYYDLFEAGVTIATCEMNKITVQPLQKRIAELEDKLEQTEKDLADYQFNYPTIKELEKENAELKARVEKQNADILFLKNLTEGQRIHLTKAKGIIRAYKNICNYTPFLTEEEMELKNKAEQFLKEVEK